MNTIKYRIIIRANEICKTNFMEYPDYDEDNPITTLVEALTVFVVKDGEMHAFDSSEIYDALNYRVNAISRENKNLQKAFDFMYENCIKLLKKYEPEMLKKTLK